MITLNTLCFLWIKSQYINTSSLPYWRSPDRRFWLPFALRSLNGTVQVLFSLVPAYSERMPASTQAKEVRQHDLQKIVLTTIYV